jgi:hypothetical protein
MTSEGLADLSRTPTGPGPACTGELPPPRAGTLAPRDEALPAENPRFRAAAALTTAAKPQATRSTVTGALRQSNRPASSSSDQAFARDFSHNKPSCKGKNASSAALRCRDGTNQAHPPHRERGRHPQGGGAGGATQRCLRPHPTPPRPRLRAQRPAGRRA